MPSHHPKKSVTSHQPHLEEKIANVKGSANDLPWWIPTPILVLIIIPMIILQRGRYCHNSSRNIPWCSDWLTNPHDIPIATPCFSWLSHHVTLFLHIFQHQPKIPAACARPWWCFAAAPAAVLHLPAAQQHRSCDRGEPRSPSSRCPRLVSWDFMGNSWKRHGHIMGWYGI